MSSHQEAKRFLTIEQKGRVHLIRIFMSIDILKLYFHKNNSLTFCMILMNLRMNEHFHGKKKHIIKFSVEMVKTCRMLHCEQ